MDADLELQRAILDIGIPPRPEILAHLEAEAQKESPDYREIERLISADVGISAALIKTINSPFYGLRAKVSSVHQAISLLGMSSVTRVVTGMALRTIAAGANLADIESHLEASAQMALVTGYIAKKLSGVDSEQAFTFGLFQNCGTLLLLARRPGYRKILELAQRTPEKLLTQTEIDQMGVSHASIGSLMAKEWGLGESITEAIWYHHDYGEFVGQHIKKLSTEKLNLAETQALIALGLLAERAICWHAGFDQTAEWKAGGQIALEYFGFSPAGYQEIVEDVQGLLAPTH
ncbi:MAG: HDOD domain-containing protein [Betaproteobacteria bacterium]|nr:HDOD domain-containing protein [Betaproteobacteria bacterium]MDE2623014.1 HDOD domain-containing protein [Betaproteobacteria bacterium]